MTKDTRVVLAFLQKSVDSMSFDEDLLVQHMSSKALRTVDAMLAAVERAHRT